MEANLFNRLQATLLAVATAGLVLLAVLNLRQEREFRQPDDGVWWVEAASGAGLEATKVLPDSPGQRAGIHIGDLLTAVNGAQVQRLADFERQLYRNDVYTKANYSITRDGIQLDSPVVVIPEPPDRSVQQALRLIGLIYLAIGLYVLFRRWTALRATHFYLFCLVSFALYALKYTGAFDLLDWTVFWTNVIAECLQPADFGLDIVDVTQKNMAFVAGIEVGDANSDIRFKATPDRFTLSGEPIATDGCNWRGTGHYSGPRAPRSAFGA